VNSRLTSAEKTVVLCVIRRKMWEIDRYRPKTLRGREKRAHELACWEEIRRKLNLDDDETGEHRTSQAVANLPDPRKGVAQRQPAL